jgi:Cu+-exporting ATPase
MEVRLRRNRGGRSPVGTKERPMAAAEDPVCGMQVDTDTDLKTEHDGETFYFCSRGCLLDFQEDPEKYLDPEYEPNM